MTAAIIVLSLTVAGMVVPVIMMVRTNATITKDVDGAYRSFTEARLQNVDLRTQLAQSIGHARELDAALAAVQKDLTNAHAQLKLTEAHRDQLLDDLTRCGDPRAVAGSIRRKLRELSDASTRTSSPAGGDSGK